MRRLALCTLGLGQAQWVLPLESQDCRRESGDEAVADGTAALTDQHLAPAHQFQQWQRHKE